MTALVDARGLIDRAEHHATEAVRLLWQAGRLLAAERADCPHGQWLPRLEAAGIDNRRASEAIRLSHLDAAELPGTVRKALAAAATERRQTPDASGVSPEAWAEAYVRLIGRTADLLEIETRQYDDNTPMAIVVRTYNRANRLDLIVEGASRGVNMSDMLLELVRELSSQLDPLDDGP